MSETINKKADVPIILIAVLIITLVVLIALLYPEYNLFVKIGGKMPYEICRNSVETASFMRFKNIELAPFLKCETQQYTITKNDVEEAKRTIADAMYNCYYQFAQGEKQLFSDEGRFCFVCSTIDFEEKGSLIGQIPALKKYLFENYANSKDTYAQYLYKDKAEQKRKRMRNDKTYDLPMQAQKMAIIFSYDQFNLALLKPMLEGKTDVVFLDLLEAAKIPLQDTSIETLGDTMRVGFVYLLNPFSAEQLNTLGCTQKIPQKNK